MPINDYKLWLHGKAAPTTGVDIGHSGDEYSEDELDFGYAAPNLGAANHLGLHVVINEAFNSALTSAQIWIVHSATATATTLLVGRYFALADLALGKHYFIPLPPSHLRYVRAYFDETGQPTAGQVCMWIGPNTDGAE